MRGPVAGGFAMTMDEMIVIDHAVEPPEAFIRHYPADKKDQAPKIMDSNGQDIWMWNGQADPTLKVTGAIA
jgi:hypothetical protein